MSDRAARIGEFLRQNGWQNALRHDLAGDASSRRYSRLIGNNSSAILMDAPTDICGTQAGFVAQARNLRDAGISAPRILAWDGGFGLLLLEDLGERDIAAIAADDPAWEATVYFAATDLLIHLQTAMSPGDLPPYGPCEMADAIRPAWTSYLGRSGSPTSEWAGVEQELQELLTRYDAPPVYIHRDYHAQNLIWLPGRTGVARVGLLDFQDAMAGHPLYDLASLLQDARRTVDAKIQSTCIARFASGTGRDPAWIDAALAVQAVQRHLRILGIFARLASERGKPGYRALLPKVWRDLRNAMRHPELSRLSAMIEAAIPAPETVS